MNGRVKRMAATDASIVPTLQAIADTDRLYDSPDSRRAWLLSKALDDHPLLKALEIAQLAERFLSGGASESRGVTGIFSRLDGAKTVKLPATIPVPVSDGIGMEDARRRTADRGDLIVLASTDDITRYLGQQGDLVTSKGNLFVVNGQSEITLDELLALANRLRVRQGLPTYALLPAALIAAAKKAGPRSPKPPQPPCRKERERWAQQVAAL
jgi:hypothetical protein